MKPVDRQRDWIGFLACCASMIVLTLVVFGVTIPELLAADTDSVTATIGGLGVVVYLTAGAFVLAGVVLWLVARRAPVLADEDETEAESVCRALDEVGAEVAALPFEWSGHLRNDTSFREVYVDRDLSRWRNDGHTA